MRLRNANLAGVALGNLFFALVFLGEATAQFASEAPREVVRLERLATNVWEGMKEDVKFGHTWDQRTLLDVFNFVAGSRYLSEELGRGRTQNEKLREIVDLLRLQSETVDRSLRIGRAGRSLLREWEETKASLEFLARSFTSGREPLATPGNTPRSQVNSNNLKIEIRGVEHTGNFFGSKYRIRGTISGRNIVSAGIYYKGRLLKPVSVQLYEGRLTENAFSLRMEPPGDNVTLRVIDERGFVLEQVIEFPTGGLLPGFQ
ncbi:MAG: hypothetical protein ACE5HC_05490 [Candidatus Binatia bacterium]